MSLTDKTVANTYKDLLTLNNSNSGVAGTGTVVQDGNGTNTMLTLGTRNSKVQPTTSNHTQTFVVDALDGTNVLAVDTTNSLVKVNQTQSIANTQYLRFGAKDIDVDVGTHIGVPIAGMGANAVVTFGTGANPAVPTQTVTADDWIHYLHYVDINITIDSVQVVYAANGVNGDSINFHLIALATTDTTTVDEFSSATVCFDSTVGVNAGYEQFYRITMAVQSANVDAGDYLALTIESNGTSSDYSVNALVRYHLR